MDKGNTKVELPDFDAGLLLTVFPPGGWKHEIHLRSLLIKIHIALTCNFSVGKTHERISFSSFPHLFNRYNVIIARFHQKRNRYPFVIFHERVLFAQEIIPFQALPDRFL